jgi:hypothetical protein
MKEDNFVQTAMAAAKSVIGPPLTVERGASLLYQVTVDNKLTVRVDPKHPKRGQAAFQTDLCIFEQVDTDVRIPRVVLEFKKRLSTHDVLIYSSKARRHKQIYPYLRYGLVVGDEAKVPGKFFTHNEALDFCVAASSFKENRLQEIMAKLLKAEIEESRKLEKITFGKLVCHLFRNATILEEGTGKVV